MEQYERLVLGGNNHLMIELRDHLQRTSDTLYNTILRIAKNLPETWENIKIESHSFYRIIFDRFSWGSSKKNPKWPIFKMAVFQNRQFSKHFPENCMDWSLGQQDFLLVFALTSESLTTIQVELFPSHQLILLTHEIFTKNFLRIGDFEKRPF